MQPKAFRLLALDPLVHMHHDSLPMPNFLTRRLRAASLGFAAILFTLAPMAAHSENWSQTLWTAAMSGDSKGMADLLAQAPEGKGPFAQELHDSVARYQEHVQQWRQERIDAHTKALNELHEKLEGGNAKLIEALNAAIKVQTVSDDWVADIKLPDVRNVIDQAEQAQQKADADGQWLISQDLLMRLRLLHEDHPELFERWLHYDDKLKEASRRVSLIAQFAPHKMHDLSREYANRYAPERQIGEYQPSPDDDWHEQVSGINRNLLRVVLRKAAEEHIDGGGWTPLIEGGVEAVKILGTTTALSESFPSLGDPAKVQAWTEAVEKVQKYVNDRLGPMGEHGRRLGEPLTESDFQSVLADLLAADRDTIDIEDSVILHEFGDGATNELERRYADDYTEIIWPARYRRFKQQVEGSFTGVGILIRGDEKGAGIRVVNPIEGSPAHRGGVKPGDLIATVNGVSTVGWSLNKAVDQIMGRQGTDVVLGLEREGVEGLIDVTLTRAIVPIRSVNGWWKTGLTDAGEPEWDWLVDPVKRIAYVRMTSFNENSYSDLLKALREAQDEAEGKALNGLILDLRYNPGGLLTSAIQVSNLFVDRGVIVSGEDRDGQEVFRQDADRTSAKYKSLPLVVLVNQGSASASEIVSGCLQAHDRAVIVGERSFGKGSVQTVHNFGAMTQLKLTVQHYLLPPRPGDVKGRLVHKKPGSIDWGVNPDIVVPMTPDQITAALELREKCDIAPETVVGDPPKNPASRPDVRDLISKGLDPQLETGLIILQGNALQYDKESAIADGRD